MWKLSQTTGQVIDHQDDPGNVWEDKIKPYWPDDMEAPSIGEPRREDDCLAKFSSDNAVLHRYPAHTPEETLASSMYFVASGREAIEKEAQVPVARQLKHARVAQDLSMPDGFVSFIDEQSGVEKEASQSTVYVDDEDRLPVGNSDQCRASIDAFQKNASYWSADERMEIAKKLKKAAVRHNVDPSNIPYRREEMAKTADLSLKLRQEAMEALGDHEGQIAYLSKIKSLRDGLSDMDTYREILKSASALEKADKRHDMDKGWGTVFPDPAATFVEPQSTPLDEIAVEKEQTKTASSVDWSSIDWDEAPVDDEVAERIQQEGPKKVIPTLPDPLKNALIDYARTS